jgi:hypothetical protein
VADEDKAPAIVLEVVALLATLAGSAFAVDLGPLHTRTSEGLLRFACVTAATVGYVIGRSDTKTAPPFFRGLWTSAALFALAYTVYVMLRSQLVVDCVTEFAGKQTATPMRIGFWQTEMGRKAMEEAHGNASKALSELNCSVNTIWSSTSVGTGEAVTWLTFFATVLLGSRAVGLAVGTHSPAT